jgi:hypothetical protein
MLILFARMGGPKLWTASASEKSAGNAIRVDLTIGRQ